ncbi:NHL repeat-containing protein [Paraliomyxa miuraensis]|uniref:hypothetical protein n=1 Tax=Paraliomyxa miuraensis TaxID=376150 RepID=UPI00224D5022|nr:hypothetical protein [Paraliomyxa miuraensis]MCX4240346.1 hypothetical protein [Paraliomyxa miuraensis]
MRWSLVGSLLLVACNGAGDDGDVWNSGTSPVPSTGAAEASADDTAGTAVMTSSGTTEAADGTSSDDGTKLDVGPPGGGGGGCGCELSYIWVANSPAGTVSKINTETMVEEGRYITRPDGSGDPSRTSVNLAGDVAVANRFGGLVKFYAEVSDCVESNGMPGIQTSTGPTDVLSWDMEECRAWYLPFPTSNQRPVAWTGGTAGPNDCDASDAQVWTVSSTVAGLFPGLGGPGGVTATLVDGDVGAIVEQVDIPAEVFSGAQFGAYGGAVDAAGNLYFVGLGTFSPGVLVRVRKDDLGVDTWPIPQGVSSYGITVDHDGNPWISSTLGSGAARFHPDTATWDVIQGFWGGSGLAEGPDDRMYVSAGGGVYSVDLVTLATDHVFVTNETVKGVGFDAMSDLWVVTWLDDEDPTPEGGVAFKIDPDTGVVIDFYNGLDHPYTYSDMTGKALGTVTCPPAG